MKQTSLRLLLLGGLVTTTFLTSCAGTSSSDETSSPSAATSSAPDQTSPETEDEASEDKANSDVTDASAARKRTHLTKAALTVRDGVTTRRDILGKLGMFYKKGTDTSGHAVATWTFKYNQATAKAYIPGAAFIPGALITYHQTLTLVLDANDVVISHQFVESTKEKTGLGFSYGN